MGDRLAGKNAFITGIAGGQGRAAALLFAREGARIIGCDMNQTGLDETVELVRRAGGRIDASGPVDLSEREPAEAWIDQGAQLAGRIDILYNNAAGVQFGHMPEVSPDAWAFTLQNELTIVLNTIRAAWRLFQAQRHGVIINTASVSAHRGVRTVGQSAHSAAKGGVLALTKQLAAEGAAFGLRANSISPAAVMTPGVEAAFSYEQRREMERSYPLGRAGRAEDVAYCALYLASDEASWITGADFVLDGGLSTII